MENITLIVILIIFILSVIALLRAIEIFFGRNQYKLFYQIIALAIIINLFVFVFLVSTFQRVKLAPGPPGPKGNRGKIGYIGVDDTCGACEVKSNKLGYSKYLKDVNELSLPPLPKIVDPEYIEPTKPPVIVKTSKNTLLSDTYLEPGNSLYSENGRFIASQKKDGYFVIIERSTNNHMWYITPKPNTTNDIKDGRLYMDKYGNLVCYTTSGTIYWESKTSGVGNYALLEDSGHLVIYDKFENLIWSSINIPCSNKLITDSSLVNSCITSFNGKYSLCQNYKTISIKNNQTKQTLWSKSITVYKPYDCYLKMQEDGNLVFYYSYTSRNRFETKYRNKVLFQTGTYGTGNKNIAIMCDDGNLVVYNSNMDPLWSSDTSGK
jgi:hypothetical protein